MAESGKCFSLKYLLANLMALSVKSSDVFRLWNVSKDFTTVCSIVFVVSTDGSSMIIRSNLPVISLSISIFLVKPSMEEVQMHNKPWLNDDFNKLTVPLSGLCLSISLSNDSITRMALSLSANSSNTFFIRLSISLLYDTPIERAIVSSSYTCAFFR